MSRAVPVALIILSVCIAVQEAVFSDDFNADSSIVRRINTSSPSTFRAFVIDYGTVGVASSQSVVL